jgi:hypothetical protein
MPPTTQGNASRSIHEETRGIAARTRRTVCGVTPLLKRVIVYYCTSKRVRHLARAGVELHFVEAAEPGEEDSPHKQLPAALNRLPTSGHMIVRRLSYVASALGLLLLGVQAAPIFRPLLIRIQPVRQGCVPQLPLGQVFGPRFRIGPQFGVAGVHLLEEELAAVGVEPLCPARPSLSGRSVRPVPSEPVAMPR